MIVSKLPVKVLVCGSPTRNGSRPGPDQSQNASMALKTLHFQQHIRPSEGSRAEAASTAAQML